MAKAKPIEGLNYAWRRIERDGETVAQRRVKQTIDVDYGSIGNPKDLAGVLLEFAAEHAPEDMYVSIDHNPSSHPDYSCDTALELTGWQDVTEAEVKAEVARVKREEQNRRRGEARIAQEQLDRLKREHPEMFT
jgi:hypothetical protein